MAEVFEAKLRRVGNSLGIIIPKEVIMAAGYDDGDIFQVSIPSENFEERNRLMRSIAGMYRGKGGFEREKEDRF